MSEQLFSLGFIAVFLRAVGMLAWIPLLVPEFRQAALFSLALLAALLFSSNVAPGAGEPAAISAVSAGCELIIGAAYGAPAAVLCAAVGCTAALIENGRGLNIGAAFDPVSGSESSALQSLGTYWSCAFLALGGGVEVIVSGWVRSLATFPPAAAPAAGALHELGRALLGDLGTVLQVCTERSAPFLAIFAALEVGAAFVLRALPGMSLGNELFLVKFAVMAAGLLLLYEHTSSDFLTALLTEVVEGWE